MSTNERVGPRYGHEIQVLGERLKSWAENIDSALLHAEPTDGEWTIMQNLVHVVEFLRYWPDQVHYVVQNPGRPFGRTHEDRDRIAFIDEHSNDRFDQVLPALEQAVDFARQRLSELEDEDFSATGISPEDNTTVALPEIVEFFIIDHLRAHIDQAKAALENVTNSKASS